MDSPPGRKALAGVTAHTDVPVAPACGEPESLFHDLAPILFVGIVVRIAVFVFLTPSGPDAHLEYIEYLVEHLALPPSRANDSAFHPPLYYVLAAPLYCLGGQKAAQCLSLALSIGTLLVFLDLFRRYFGTVPRRAVRFGFALLALLPPFVLNGLFISNDALAYFMGALIIRQGASCIRAFSPGNRVRLALCLGLGLLSKHTLLPLVPGALLLLGLLHARQGTARSRILASVAIFCLVTALTGGYKFAENLAYEGRPFVHNLDFDPAWAEFQRPTYLGPASIFDVNLMKLVLDPVLSEETGHSIFLIMHATLWYHCADYVLTFNGCRSDLRVVGRFIYLFSVLPTLLIGLGLCRWIQDLKRLTMSRRFGNPAFALHALESFAIVSFLLTVAGVVVVGIRYDVWSAFHARLLFGAVFGVATLLCMGWSDFVKRATPGVARIVGAGMVLEFGFLVFYFLAEIALMVFGVAIVPDPVHWWITRP